MIKVVTIEFIFKKCILNIVIAQNASTLSKYCPYLTYLTHSGGTVISFREVIKNFKLNKI